MQTMGKQSEEADRYEAYTDERLRLLNARLEQSRSFDKLLTTLSVAAFGFSVGYIELIRPTPIQGPRWLLAAWACFFLSLISVLLSFLTSQRACTRQVEIAKQVLLSNDRSTDSSRYRNCWAKATMWLNGASFVGLLGGMALLAVFAIQNLPE